MILVTGATGHVGSELIRQLIEQGRAVRALVRDQNAAVPGSVELVVGDLNRIESWSGALEGVHGVFLLSGYDNMPGMLAAMRHAGVAQIVLLSSQSAADSDTTNAVARYHILSEAAVRESGLAWTFLRPSSFMSNALRWIPQLRRGDVVREAFGDVRVAAVDPYDIAAVAIEALSATRHVGCSYRLTGPEALSADQRVRILGGLLERDLRFEPMSDEEARADLSSSMPAEYIAAFFDLFRGGRYDESTVHPTVEEITARPPRTFKQWATMHASAFR